MLFRSRTANVLMVRVQNYECVACAGTGAVNAHTKLDINNPFPDTQMFVQPKNNIYKCNKENKNVLNRNVTMVVTKHC